MRPVTDEIYGIPPERVIGSSTALDYTSDDHGGTIMRKPEADFLDDGPEKPVRIWSRIGRRPILAAGNSNGDIPMLDFAQHADKPRCGCSSCTTTPSANSTTPQARRRPRAREGGRLDGRQHQERLGDRLHNLIGDAIAGFSALSCVRQLAVLHVNPIRRRCDGPRERR